MKIKITKLEELPDALHPNNISVGYETIREVYEDYFKEPCVDYRFNVGSFSTSRVTEIIDEHTFKTLSSIYKWEIVEDEL